MIIDLIAALGYGKTLMAVAGVVLIIGGAVVIGAARRPGGAVLVAAGACLLSVSDLDTFPEPSTATAFLEGAP